MFLAIIFIKNSQEYFVQLAWTNLTLSETKVELIL
jgi:hypothetical protein